MRQCREHAACARCVSAKGDQRSAGAGSKSPPCDSAVAHREYFASPGRRHRWPCTLRFGGQTDSDCGTEVLNSEARGGFPFKPNSKSDGRVLIYALILSVVAGIVF